MILERTHPTGKGIGVSSVTDYLNNYASGSRRTHARSSRTRWMSRWALRSRSASLSLSCQRQHVDVSRPVLSCQVTHTALPGWDVPSRSRGP
jgi:hypothetical protein